MSSVERIRFDKNRPECAKTVAAIAKLRTQVINTPEGRLMFAVFSQALEDSVPMTQTSSWSDTLDARHYLRGDMPHLDYAGIDQEWALKVLNSLGLLTWESVAA